VNWYTARVLFRCDVAGKPHPYEESYLLVRANSERAAFRAAKRAAGATEGSYDNVYGRQVRYRLVSILDVQEVLESDLSEGVEVYSRRVSSRAAASMLKAAKGLKLLTDNRFKQ
jgi:hypothetical protein